MPSIYQTFIGNSCICIRNRHRYQGKDQRIIMWKTKFICIWYKIWILSASFTQIYTYTFRTDSVLYAYHIDVWNFYTIKYIYIFDTLLCSWNKNEEKLFSLKVWCPLLCIHFSHARTCQFIKKKSWYRSLYSKLTLSTYIFIHKLRKKCSCINKHRLPEMIRFLGEKGGNKFPVIIIIHHVTNQLFWTS